MEGCFDVRCKLGRLAFESISVNIIYIWLCRSNIIYVASFASLFFIHSSPNFRLYRNFSLKPKDPKTLRESFWTLNNAKIKKTKVVSIIISWKTDAASASSRKLCSLNFGCRSWGRNRNALTKYVFNFCFNTCILFLFYLYIFFRVFDLVQSGTLIECQLNKPMQNLDL